MLQIFQQLKRRPTKNNKKKNIVDSKVGHFNSFRTFWFMLFSRYSRFHVKLIKTMILINVNQLCVSFLCYLNELDNYTMGYFGWDCDRWMDCLYEFVMLLLLLYLILIFVLFLFSSMAKKMLKGTRNEKLHMKFGYWSAWKWK